MSELHSKRSRSPKRTNFLKVCGICGEKFRAYKAKMRFCSRTCSVRGRFGPTRRAITEEHNCKCYVCKKPLYRKRKLLKPKKKFFCSVKCRGVYNHRYCNGSANPNFRNAGWQECEGCGGKFKSYDKRRRFCGIDCSQKLSKSEYLSNARRGIHAEKLCAEELTNRGYLATRSKGSRGAYDVIAVDDKEIILISVKRTKAWVRRALPPAIRALRKAKAPTASIVRKQLWTLVDNYGWHIVEVT